MKLTEEENPLSIKSKIEYLNGLAVKNNESKFLISEKEEKQILDDYEKARKWELAEKFYSDNGQLINSAIENQKLRELIEKRIKSLEPLEKRFMLPSLDNEIHKELQQLLEESKTSNNFREIKILEDDE